MKTQLTPEQINEFLNTASRTFLRSIIIGTGYYFPIFKSHGKKNHYY
ncbi:hypothetical protein [Chryseobacterium sp. ON_d1]|nr:hypothetical protein [Chryseobacterium sp. ON_d1]